MMKPEEIERIEVDLLLEAVYQRYGYDFRSYARASVDRRIRQFVSAMDLESISGLIPLILYDGALFSHLAQQFSVSVTEMFRDPLVFRVLREQVIPVLKSYPFIKVWAAGCATGEEVYSLAITLQEENVLDRSTLFGTDFNDHTLQVARTGIYSVKKLQEFTRNYQEAGGNRSFSEYYHAQYDAAALDASLKKQIVFANHNLTVDGVFGEMNLVFCRNVLIYFNRDLQDRALELFCQSLVRGGFLVLGSKEDLRFSRVNDHFDVVHQKARIYRKRNT